MIHGVKVQRPDKQKLAQDIAQLCGLEAPSVSTGSSVESAFLDQIHKYLTGTVTKASDTYRKTEAILDVLGLTYDPYWDTSESALTGGGTVTTRAYSRIRSKLSGEPRCFILNVNDAPVGTRWETNHHEVYRYDSNVTGIKSLNDAGPGSLVIYYSTKKSRAHSMKFVANAVVGYIHAGWQGPWEARLEDFTEFPSPVPVKEFELPGWNRQNAITEITFQTYQSLVRAGGSTLPDVTYVVDLDEADPARLEQADRGSTDVAERVLHDFGSVTEPVRLEIPDVLPLGKLTGAAPARAFYVEDDDGVVRQGSGWQGGSNRNRSRDRLAEQRAIEIATKGMESSGWSLAADRQKDGVGYDLEFQRDGRLLKIEVKGIQSQTLSFNLTPKEYWRAESDPCWALVAVTSVLSPAARAHFVTRDKVLSGTLSITGYRLILG